MVVARRAGGASRSLYEPVIQSLRDLAMPGVLLSGPRDEGMLIGNLRPQQAQPGRARLVTRDRGVETIQADTAAAVTAIEAISEIIATISDRQTTIASAVE